jgi:hypothetical protein
MKKNLIIAAVLSMYVFLCGCPYEVSDTNSVQDLPGTTINVDGLLNQTFNGNLKNGIPVIVSLATNPLGANIYFLTIKSNPNGEGTVTYTCFFTTITFTSNGIQMPPDTMMEAIQNYPLPPTNFNHLFAIIKCSSNPGSFKLTDIITMPNAITNNSFQIPNTPPSAITSVLIQRYLTYINTPIGNQKPAPNTDKDGGGDWDSEIRNLH